MRNSKSPNITLSVSSNKTSNIPLEGFKKQKMWTATRAGATKKCERQRGREQHNWLSRHLQREKLIFVPPQSSRTKKSVAAAWVAETLRCKIACARKVLKSYVVHHSNSKTRVRWVPNACWRWKTWTPATHFQQAHAKQAFSHERCCKNQKCDARRGRHAQKKVNGMEGENAISAFRDTPWARTAIC